MVLGTPSFYGQESPQEAPKKAPRATKKLAAQKESTRKGFPDLQIKKGLYGSWRAEGPNRKGPRLPPTPA